MFIESDDGRFRYHVSKQKRNGAESHKSADDYQDDESPDHEGKWNSSPLTLIPGLIHGWPMIVRTEAERQLSSRLYSRRGNKKPGRFAPAGSLVRGLELRT